MLCSEQDARNKKCPHDGSACIASGCMRWRWGPYFDDRERRLINKETGKEVSMGYTWDVQWVPVNPDDPPPKPLGFCGEWANGK